MTFKELNAAILVVGAVAISGWVAMDALGSGAWQGPATGIAQTLVYAIFASIAFNIVAAIVMTILVSIVRGRQLKDERADERDREVASRSMRNAYFVASIGGALSLALVAWGPDNAVGAYALFGALMLAGATDSASRLYYYRFG